MQAILFRERYGRIHQASSLAGRVHENLLVTLPLGISIVAALHDDVDFFPHVQADIIHDQGFRRDIPSHAGADCANHTRRFRAEPQKPR